MASETRVNESETRVNDVDTTEQDGSGPQSHQNDASPGWLASSALRIGLVLVGGVLLLAALGQLSGVDFLGETAELLGTHVGRWLLVALVALALIAVAVHGFTGRSD